MYKLIGLFVFGIALVSACSGPDVDPETFKRHAISSQFLPGRDRVFNVQLPPSYASSPDKSYPVFFHLISSRAHINQTREIVFELASRREIPEMIIVHLHQEGTNRADITPTFAENSSEGNAKGYLSYLAKEVIPLVETEYRTSDDRIFAGWGRFAAIAGFAFAKKPEIFSGYIIRGADTYLEHKSLSSAIQAMLINAPEMRNIFFYANHSVDIEAEQSLTFNGLTDVLSEHAGSSLRWHSKVIEGVDQDGIYTIGLREGLQFYFENTGGSRSQDENSLPKGLYLGQKPPNSVPKPFAPGIVVSDGWEYGLTFTPALNEAYYLSKNLETDKHEMIQLMDREGVWTRKIISPRRGQPTISPDGKTMHLGRRYRERIGDGWSDVKMLEPPFDETLIMRMTSSANGTLYFDTFDRDNVAAPLRYSQIIDGQRQAPIELGPEINTGTHMSHPFIAPDESYLIWDAKREGGYGDSDLYISFRQKDGRWGNAINLGDRINTSAWEAAATVTPDGKYLFFNRNIGSSAYENVDIMWVDASFIEDLRPLN